MPKRNYDDLGGEYKYGFHTDTTPLMDTGKGLSIDVIKKISASKNEPEWMLNFRLDSYKKFLENL